MNEPLDLEDAQARLLALVPSLPTEHVAVEAALGRYLAKDVCAARTQPAADLSAMDGYALAPGKGPWALVGESRAGTAFTANLHAGECVRISTGAAVPKGADRVLLQEDAGVEGGQVTALDLPLPGRHIRAQGFDFQAGQVLLTRGTAITAGRIALAITAGHSEVTCTRPPRVAVLDSGDELASDPAHCAPHQIPASNGAMISALLAPFGCEVLRLGPVRDDRAALAAALSQAEHADILITSGGASVGDHDLIKPALAEWGAKTAFWKVAIKPGKPLLVATKGTQVILGLPGNPVSCFVTAVLFALPLVRAAIGATNPLPVSKALLAAETLPAVGKRREFLRGVRANGAVELVGSQDSSALTALAQADCLIDRPANSSAVVVGEPVTVFPL